MSTPPSTMNVVTITYVPALRTPETTGPGLVP